MVALGSFLSLTGCAVNAVISQEEAGPFPANYKVATADYIKSTFKDPYSLRDVMISKPIPYKILNHTGYVVCFQANAKNSFGGYTGIDYTEIMIEKEKVWSTGNNYCNQRGGLEPWSEMENHKN